MSSDGNRREKEYSQCVLAYLDVLTARRRLQSVAPLNPDGGIDILLAVALLWVQARTWMRQMMEHFWVLVMERLSTRRVDREATAKVTIVIVDRAYEAGVPECVQCELRRRSEPPLTEHLRRRQYADEVLEKMFWDRSCLPSTAADHIEYVTRALRSIWRRCEYASTQSPSTFESESNRKGEGKRVSR